MPAETPPINWDTLRHAGDHVMPNPFDAYDRDGNPGEGIRLDRIAHGSRVVDRDGQRFLLLGYGSVQGAYVLRDRNRAQFQMDGGACFKVASR